MIKRVIIENVRAGKKGEKTSKYEVLFNITSLDIKEKELTIGYSYAVKYEGNVGYIIIEGKIFAEEDEETIKEIKEEYEKNKRLPEKYMERVINVINYVGTINATIISNVVNLVPPVKLPILKVKSQ